MRSRFKIFLFALLILTLFAFTCAQASAPSGEDLRPSELLDEYVLSREAKAPETAQTKPSFTLPASLQIIDDSAFEGTALVSVDIPESVTYIGDHAFANIPTLLSVHIPDTTRYIGKEAFTNSRQVTITASANSYARDWAKENGFRFQLPVTFSAGNGMVQYVSRDDQGFRSSRRERTETTDNPTIETRERRTGRSFGELKAAQYKGVAYLYIQSRYFP